jgi:hypothetical protein
MQTLPTLLPRVIVDAFIVLLTFSQTTTAQTSSADSLRQIQEDNRRRQEEAAQRDRDWRERIRQQNEEARRRLQEQMQRNEEANQRRQAEAEQRRQQMREQTQRTNESITRGTSDMSNAIQGGVQRYQENRIEQFERTKERQREERESEAQRQDRIENRRSNQAQQPSSIRSSATTDPQPTGNISRYTVVRVPDGDRLNVRSGPGTTFPTICTVGNGYSDVVITGPVEMNGSTDWYPVTAGTFRGYIRGKYLEAR